MQSGKRLFTESNDENCLGSNTSNNDTRFNLSKKPNLGSAPFELGTSSNTGSNSNQTESYSLPLPSFSQPSPVSSSPSSHQKSLSFPQSSTSSVSYDMSNDKTLPVPSTLQNTSSTSPKPSSTRSRLDNYNILNTNSETVPSSENSSPSPSPSSHSSSSAILVPTDKNSASSTASRTQPITKKVFRRSYKACLNCRAKKIRCDLGDLASPSDPPCARCRREGKKCEFSVSRRGGAGNIRAGREKRAKIKAESSSSVTNSAISTNGNGLTYANSNNGIGIVTTSKSNADLVEDVSLRNELQHNHQNLDHSSDNTVSGSKQATTDSLHNQSSISLDSINSPSTEISSRAFTVKELNNPRDALGILAHAAGIQSHNDPGQTPFNTQGSPTSPSGEQSLLDSSSARNGDANNTPDNDGFVSAENPNISSQYTHSTLENPDSSATSQRRNEPYARMHIESLMNINPPSNSSGSRNDSATKKTSQPEKISNKRRSRTRVGADACSRSDLVSDISNRFTLHPCLIATEVVRKQFLTAQEALLFIKFFFEALHPFYPYIPDFIQSTEALVSMPILLTAILTISSRYCKYAEKGTRYYISAKRGSSIHRKLWNHCNRLMSNTAWGEASTRSLGTVYAFLLLSEWNPRAIHWRSNDYANSPLGTGEDLGPGSRNNPATHYPVDAPKTGTDQESDEEEAEKQKPVLPPGDTAFSASERSDRMSWLFIGSAIRLAQDLGLFDTNSKVFLATHISETNLALRLGRRSMLQVSLNEDIPDLAFSPTEEAQLALLRVMSLAHQTIYPSKKVTRELREGTRYLSLLNLLGSLLLNWEKSYSHLYEEESLEKDSILFDYYYARLYIFSFALSNRSMSGIGSATSNDSIYKSLSDGVLSAKYIRLAVDAAYQMIGVVQHVHEMGRLCLAPIRWVVRLVHAAVFLVKTVLVSSVEAMPMHQGTLEVIKATAVALKESSPDHLHLANRYASILNNWVDETKAKCLNENTYFDNGPRMPKMSSFTNSTTNDAGTMKSFSSSASNSMFNAEKHHNLQANELASQAATPDPKASVSRNAEEEGSILGNLGGNKANDIEYEKRHPGSFDPRNTSLSSSSYPQHIPAINVGRSSQLIGDTTDTSTTAANVESPSFEQLFSYSSQDPGSNSNVFLSNMNNAQPEMSPGVAHDSNTTTDAGATGNSNISGVSNGKTGSSGSHGSKLGYMNNNIMDIYGDSAASSAFAAISAQPNTNEPSLVSAVMRFSGGLNVAAAAAMNPVGSNSFGNANNFANFNTSGTGGLNNGNGNIFNIQNSNINSGFYRFHPGNNGANAAGSSFGASTPNSNSNTNNGNETLGLFDFNFLEDGYEGLGFVDQLMSGMESELEKKQKKEKVIK